MFIKYPIFFSDYANCSLPDCFCSVDGTLVPGGLDPKDVPQLIYITFDDAINDENWKLYQVCAKNIRIYISYVLPRYYFILWPFS